MEKKKEKKRKHHESLQANNTIDDDNDDDEDDNDDDKNGKHDTNNNGDKVKGNEETTLPNFLLNKQQIFDNNNSNDDKSKSNSKNKYHQLGLNPVALEQEIADLRGERGAVPPVFLSPAMAVQAQGILPESSLSLPSWMSPSSDESKKSKCCSVTYDHELSIQWAKELKESMIPAETTRRSEDMRPMAYQLMPEPWSRMRPDWQNTTSSSSSSSSSNEAATVSDTRIHDQIFVSTPANINIKHNTQKEAKEEPYVITTKPCEWAAGVCRPPVDCDDVDMALVFEYLHQQPNFHVSCGSKFGSDFLIYDGPRDERHAFAGMRVLVPSREKDSGTSATKNTTTNNNNNNNNNASRLPLPTAYSMAGYVRCLNTAGKLAILATVVRDTAATDDADDDDSGTTTMYRIAFVDVALEKILSAPTHQKRFKTNKRRDVGKNLAKK